MRWLWIFQVTIWSFTCYIICHTFWLAKKRKKFISKSARLVKDNIRKGKYSNQTEVDTDIIRYIVMTLWSFNKMYFHFWVWNLKKMAQDKKAFEEVENFIEKSEGNVLPFKEKVTDNHKLREPSKSSCQQHNKHLNET